MGGSNERVERGRILPAYVEIMLAIGDLEAANEACEELEALRAAYETDVVRAQAAQARGAWCARSGDASKALGHLREAFDCWVRFEAPYEAARVRVALAGVCAALGDEEASALELDAARATFEQLGASFDLAKLVRRRDAQPRTEGLTPREVQVLRLVARGHTNKAIARELGLSDRTVDRHLCNILVKLKVPSRAAAAAHASVRQLV
jgi:DNA-binding CsgD family transcriptional regulator